jgi:hypothetical protein
MSSDEKAMKTVGKGERFFKDSTFDSLARLRRGEPTSPEGERIDRDNEERQTETWHTFKTP